jgi:hypothetical protein
MPSQRSPRASGDGHGGRPRSSIFHPNLCSSSLPHHATSQLLVRRPSLPCDQTQAGPQLSFSASPPPCPSRLVSGASILPSPSARSFPHHMVPLQLAGDLPSSQVRFPQPFPLFLLSSPIGVPLLRSFVRRRHCRQ